MFGFLFGPEATLRRRQRRFLAYCRKRGLTGEQFVDELQFRHAFVRLRRRATVAVIASPADANKIISEIAADVANDIALHNKPLAKRFVRAVDAADDADILYPKAIKAMVAEARATVKLIPRQPVTDDDIAAVTTL